MPSTIIEHMTTTCPYCHKGVQSIWIKDKGLLSRPEYAIIGDLIFHTECLNQQLAEHPPLSE